MFLLFALEYGDFFASQINFPLTRHWRLVSVAKLITIEAAGRDTEEDESDVIASLLEVLLLALPPGIVFKLSH